MLDWSLLSGPVPVVVRLVALAAGVWLLWVTLLWRRRGWLAIAELIVCLLVAALATVVVDHLARDVWMLFPDRLDLAIYLWVGVALFAVCLAVRHIASRPRLRRGAVLVTAAALEGCAVPARQGGGCQGAGNPSEHRSVHCTGVDDDRGGAEERFNGRRPARDRRRRPRTAHRLLSPDISRAQP